jgi:hypothetical protein
VVVGDLQGAQILEPNPLAVEQGFDKTRQLHFHENGEEERKINELTTYMLCSDCVFIHKIDQKPHGFHMVFLWVLWVSFTPKLSVTNCQ